MKTLTNNHTGLIFVLLLSALFFACGNNLLALPPTLVSVTLVGEPQLTVSYDQTTINFTTSSAVTVLAEYGNDQDNLTFATPQTSSASTTHTLVLYGLQPTTTYYYRIRAFLSSSRSFAYDVASFSTTVNPGAPGISTGPSATPALSSITIDWTSPVNVTHSIEWGTSTGVYPNATPVSTAASTAHSVTVTGLTQGQTIYYRIRMFWDGGANYRSNEFTATTNAENPPDYARARGIWIIGGLSGSAISTTVGAIDLYDPVTNTWYSNVASGAAGTYVPVSFAAYAAYNGKLYVIGGFDSTGACRNDVQIYDTTNNSWSTGTPITAARANITAAVYNGRIYIVGGTQNAANGVWGALNTAYEYNIAGNSWSTLLAPGAVVNRLALAYGGVIYHLGGRTNVTTYANTHEGYTIATNTATSGTEVVLSAIRAGMAGTVYTKTGVTPSIIIIGGISASTGTTNNYINQGTTTATVLNTVQYLRYPFVGPSTWISINTGKEYPTSIAFSSAIIATVAGNSYVYNFGGTQALGASASGQAAVYRVTAPPEPPTTWDPVSWESRVNMPVGRWGHGTVTFANQE